MTSLMSPFTLHMKPDLINSSLAALGGMALALLGCIGLNKAMNQHVLETCDQQLNKIVYMRTALGDSYGCISRNQVYGPPVPLKP